MKKSTMRGLAAFAAFALIGTLGACSASVGGSSDPQGKVSGTISVLTTDPLQETIAPAFEKKYPGTKVKVQVVGDIGTIQQQVRTQLTSGTAPDVFSVFPGSGNPSAVQTLAAAGPFMYDLSDREWANTLPDGIKSSSSYKDKVFAALYTVNSIGAIYNDDAVAAAGLTPPTTWSEVLDFCSAAAAQGAVGYALGAQDSWTLQMINYALTSTLVYSPDPKFNSEQASGDVTFDSSAWTDSFQQYQEMIDAGCFQSDLLGTSYDASLDLVASGSALGIVQGNWTVAPLVERATEKTFTMSPFPAADDADATTIPVAAGAGLAVNAKAKNLSTSLAWVDFVMSPEGLKLATDLTGGMPPYPVDTIEPLPALAIVGEFLAAGRTSSFPDQAWPNPMVQSDHLAGLQEILSGTSTSADVMKKMQEAYDEG